MCCAGVRVGVRGLTAAQLRCAAQKRKLTFLNDAGTFREAVVMESARHVDMVNGVVFLEALEPAYQLRD